jgi:protoheme ferro-lyase
LMATLDAHSIERAVIAPRQAHGATTTTTRSQRSARNRSDCAAPSSSSPRSTVLRSKP